MRGLKFKITEQGRKRSTIGYEKIEILERVLDYTKPGLDDRLYYHYKVLMISLGNDVFFLQEDVWEDELCCGHYELDI